MADAEHHKICEGAGESMAHLKSYKICEGPGGGGVGGGFDGGGVASVGEHGGWVAAMAFRNARKWGKVFRARPIVFRKRLTI